MKKIIRLTESDLVDIVKRVINEEATLNEKASFRLFNCLAKNLTNKFTKSSDSALSDGRTSYERRDIPLSSDAKGTKYTQIINAYKKGNDTFITLSTTVNDVPTKTAGIKKNEYFNSKPIKWSANEVPLMDCSQLNSFILKNSPVNLVPQKYFI